jgi:hypothetical protein
MRSVLDAPAPIERTAPSKQPIGRPAFLAFVADAETERLLQECITQLALGQGTIMRGGIAKAIEHLGQHRSPHILIVDVSGVDLPISKVNQLADVCEPGVRVMTPVGERLFVLSSEEPLSEDLHFTTVAVETLVSALREQFHYVIVDVPRIPVPPYRRALEIADFCVMVADQTLRSVRDTVRLRKAIGDGKRASILVVNRHGEGGRHAVTLHELEHVVEVKPRPRSPRYRAE